MIRDMTTDNITDLKAQKADLDYVDAALATKAPIDSPVFTGDPQAPTPSAGDNDTSIATTEYVQTEISTGTAMLGVRAVAFAFAARHG